MGMYSFLKTLKWASEADPRNQISVQERDRIDFEVEEEKKREFEQSEKEYVIYKNNCDVYYQEEPTIKFLQNIPEVNGNVEIIVNGVCSVYVYIEENVYFIEFMGKDNFTWCKLGEGDYDYMRGPSKKIIHDYTECISNNQKIFEDAVSLYVRAAFYNTKQMGKYDYKKSRDILDLAKEFAKINLEMVDSEDRIQICTGKFLYDEFCKKYLESKN